MANPLLALSVQPANIDLAGSIGRGQEMQTAKLGNLLAQYQIQKAQKADQQANALSQLYGEIGPGLVAGEEGAVNRLAQVDPMAALGVRKEGLGIEKAQTDITKAKGDIKKADIEIALDRADFIARSAAGIIEAPPAARPLLYQRALQQAKDIGMDVAGAPPQYDENAVKAMMDQGLTVKDRIAQHIDAERLAETKRSNLADESNTRRGQNMTDARARETASRQEYRLMTKEEKTAAGLPAESAYQVNDKGQISRVAGNTSVRPIPSSALSGIQSNRRTLSKIDQAIAAIEKNPSALGAKNYIGDAVNQRVDPKGVPVRALVADIGSQKLHDRSGAAVTAAESPRLMPFIPAVTDTPEAAVQKLKNLRAEYETSVDEAEAFYSPEAGYMSLPSRDGKKPGDSGGKPVAGGVIDFNELPD
jgi:hypothetical protein